MEIIFVRDYQIRRYISSARLIYTQRPQIRVSRLSKIKIVLYGMKKPNFERI